VRLSRAAQIENFHFKDSEKREKYLKHALMPLLNINHEESAQVGQRLLARYSFIIGHKHDRNENFQEDVDQRVDWCPVRTSAADRHPAC
jgi:hypothetical protein